MVICSADVVAFGMGKLAFDNIGAEAVFIQDGGGCGAEAVRGGAAVIAHAVESIKQGVLTHIALGVVLVGEKMLAVAAMVLNLTKQVEGLGRERYYMLFTYFHALGRNAPLSFIPIDFFPPRTA